MSARKTSRRRSSSGSSSRRPRQSLGGSRTGQLALKLGLVAGLVALVTLLAVGMLIIANMKGVRHGSEEEMEKVVANAYLVCVILALVGGGVIAGVAYAVAAGLAARVTDLSHLVAKLGRGSEVRIRISGNDEITSLGRSIQSLATDYSSLTQQDEEGGGMVAAFDPQVRELRDKTLPEGMDAPEGYEVDGALSAGSRGGLDYFDCISADGAAVQCLLSSEGAGTMAAIAVRMARDELLRALGTGATARKALAHTNRVLHRNLPRGACAKATLLEILGDEVKIYQAGFRTPVYLCARGQVEELQAEGLALGLDEGPVFERSLRSEKVQMAAGVRLVQLNEVGSRLPGLVDLIAEHSPKHTAPFMNLVLGAIEEDAGEEGLREDVVLLTAKKS